MPVKVAVLASHTGTNLRALSAAAVRPGSAFAVGLVISNNSGSGALGHARELGIPGAHLSGRTHPDPADLDQAMLTLLRQHGIGLVITAGYLKKLGPSVLAHYERRAINIHPSLLPRHGGPGMYGRRVHEAVLRAGDPVSGASIHWVTAHYDEGEVIARREVPVLADDDVESLAERVLSAEHALLPETVQALAAASRR
jgi:phosphoribosylglycinamide formyltransferase-1